MNPRLNKSRKQLFSSSVALCYLNTSQSNLQQIKSVLRNMICWPMTVLSRKAPANLLIHSARQSSVFDKREREGRPFKDLFGSSFSKDSGKDILFSWITLNIPSHILQICYRFTVTHNMNTFLSCISIICKGIIKAAVGSVKTGLTLEFIHLYEFQVFYVYVRECVGYLGTKWIKMITYI